MPKTSESSGNPVVRISRSPQDLRGLRNEVFPVGILAYTLLRCEAALRNMCFIDNEFGNAEQAHIDAIAFRCVNITNAALAAQRRLIRVFSIQPFSKRHHHIIVEWGIVGHTAEDDTVVQMQPLEPLIANLYTPSKRVQDEEEERVGPRRGEKLKRPKKSDVVLSVKKKRHEYDNDRELDARDSGGDIDTSPNQGGDTDTDAHSIQTDSKNDSYSREMANA